MTRNGACPTPIANRAYIIADIFEELGLEEPATFDQEIANCQKILDSGCKCDTIGTNFLWTAGGWFDYLNMRTNGYGFHSALLAGEQSWDSPEVRETFANWRKLIDMGAFIDNHTSNSWQETLPFILNGDATAYLMGNFAVAPMREGGLDDGKLDFPNSRPSTRKLRWLRTRRLTHSTFQPVRRMWKRPKSFCASLCQLKIKH